MGTIKYKIKLFFLLVLFYILPISNLQAQHCINIYTMIDNNIDKYYLNKNIDISKKKTKNTIKFSYQHINRPFRSNFIPINGKQFLYDKIRRFEKSDKYGIGMTITAMFVVFGELIMLYLIFKFIGSIAIFLSTRRTIQASGITKAEIKSIFQPSGEIFAAIAMGIYEATEMHDEENAVITIKNTARNYSPWNSKIYTLRKNPNKK